MHALTWKTFLGAHRVCICGVPASGAEMHVLRRIGWCGSTRQSGARDATQSESPCHPRSAVGAPSTFPRVSTPQSGPDAPTTRHTRSGAADPGCCGRGSSSLCHFRCSRFQPRLRAYHLVESRHLPYAAERDLGAIVRISHHQIEQGSLAIRGGAASLLH